jgi:hypothetical protein
MIEEFTLLYMVLSSVQLTDHKDSVTWKWSIDGKYSASSAYECQWWGATILYPAMSVWRAITEPKCKFFAWLAMHNKVLTTDNLLKRNWSCNYYCSICFCIHETIDHLLTWCNYTEAVWNLVTAKFHFPSYSHLPQEGGHVGWILHFLRSGTKKDKRRKLGMLFSFWWEVWKEQNRRIF